MSALGQRTGGRAAGGSAVGGGTRPLFAWPWFALAVTVQLVALYWPRPVDPAPGTGLDKVVHACIFAAVLVTGLRAGLPGWPLAAALAVHAGLSEIVQGQLLGRDADVADVVADLVGLALAAGVRRVTLGGRPDTADRHRQ